MWVIALLVGAAVIGVYAFALPDVVHAALYTGVSAVAAVTVFVAVRLHRPRVRLGWWLLGAGQAAATIADAIFFGWPALVAPLPFPSVADAFYLAQYPLSAAGLLLLVRSRTPGWDVPSIVDAAIVTASAALLSWVFLITPAAASGTTLAGSVVAASYPASDLLMLVVAARLLLGAGDRPVALRLLAGYLAALFTADAVYALQVNAGTYQAGGWLDLIWIASSTLLAAAALHPSMRTVDVQAPAAPPLVSSHRLALLAAASVLAPATLVVQHIRDAPLHVYLVATICAALFLLVVARLGHQVDIQRQLAITDGLTRLRTRRFFDETLETEVGRAERDTRPVALLLLDVDHFKRINDRYGHSIGDLVLVEIAERLRNCVRTGDVVARYGGEEFAVLLPGASPVDASMIAERIRAAVEATPIPVSADTSITTTVSVGVATLPTNVSTSSDLVLLADRLLYTSKEAGRNRVATPAGLVTR
ncbi:GGDEF domain-containing protein [Cryptosporangium japonicum]|uniref:GGDEF domain-containing protein n=1 Tax=Cryptosporangium japonicum TaxID=80872 RepID=A0ABP3EAX0_9ACTN